MISIQGEPINITRFPDNTSQVWKLPVEKYKYHVSVVWKYSHEAEIMELMQLKMLLTSRGLTADLDILYLPYARQDKEVSNDTTFALRAFAYILNSMKWNAVAIQDPHSTFALELIDKSYAYYPRAELNTIRKHTDTDILCYPDKGAFNKYNELYDYFCCSANKVRNQQTGEIMGMTLNDPEIVKDKVVLIVDDICDGGRTFIEVTKLLKEAGAKEVNLFVTHGLFTKGLRPLKEAGIKNCYTPKGVVLRSDFQESY